MQTIFLAIASALSACAPWPIALSCEVEGAQSSDAGNGAAACDRAPAAPQIARFPAAGGLTHAEDGVILPDGRVLVGDWNHGLVTVAPDGTIAPFGDFAAAGFRTKPDPLWNSPNGISWEPDGRHALVADITGGHIYRVDTVTEAVARIYDHPFGVNAAIRDPAGAIWFTQSTQNAAGAGSQARMFAAADRPMGDGSVWRIAPEEVGKASPRAVRLVDGLDFANGIVFDDRRGRLYVAEIVASRVLSFALDPASGALSDRRVLARVTTPDNLELARDGMLWAASPFANAVYVIDPDSGAVSTVLNPDPAKSARMVAEFERRQAAGEPVLPLLSGELWAPMPGLITGMILPRAGSDAYVSGLGDALVRLDTIASSRGATAEPEALEPFARDYARAWSSQIPEKVAAFYSENGRLTVNGGKPAIGRAAIADVARGFMEAFPDMVVAFDRLEPSGERMRFHWTLTGTNTGPGGTGARVRISGVEAWAIGSDRLITDSHGTFDEADYSRQLGASDQGNTAALMPVLEDRTRVILEGIRSGDVAPIMALYAPGALYSSDNATLLSSAQAIETFWVQVAASPAQDATLEVLRIERLAPDAFVEIQKYDVFDAEGARLFGGYASLLWRRIEGRWLIAADVSN